MSVAQFEKRLTKLQIIPDAAIRASAVAVVKIAEQEGGSVVLGKKKRRVKLTARPRVRPVGPGEVEVTVWGTPTGVWVWKTTGTSAHQIPKRKPTARKPRPMFAPHVHDAQGDSHPVQRTQVRHPGTTGHGAWTRVEKRAAKVIDQIFHDEIRKAVNNG